MFSFVNMWPPICALMVFVELSCGHNIHGDRDRDFEYQDSLTVKLLGYLVGIVLEFTGTNSDKAWRTRVSGICLRLQTSLQFRICLVSVSASASADTVRHDCLQTRMVVSAKL